MLVIRVVSRSMGLSSACGLLTGRAPSQSATEWAPRLRGAALCPGSCVPSYTYSFVHYILTFSFFKPAVSKPSLFAELFITR